MKLKPWLLPGAALLVTGGWIATKKSSTATLEREIAILTERIQQARRADERSPGAREAGAKPRNGKDERIDWKGLSVNLAAMRNGDGMPDMRAMIRLQRLILDMSADELCAQIDEIAGLDLDDMAKKQLQGMLLNALAEKDPKRAIEQFGAKNDEDESGVRWSFRLALGKWAEKEPAAAAAWLDRQIAEGKFVSKSLDGKSQDRLGFEGMLVSALLKTDPAAASARVAALPEEQREDFFKQGFFPQIKPGSEKAYAKLVRDNLTADKATGVLANAAGNMARSGSFERVDHFIADSNATDREKTAIVCVVMENQLGRKGGAIDVETLDKAREWGATHAPAAADAKTGEVLANTIWRGGNFKDASAMALQYNEQAGNDAVLAAFLKSSPVRNNSAKDALPLIEQIQDPALRDEILALPQYKNQYRQPMKLPLALTFVILVAGSLWGVRENRHLTKVREQHREVLREAAALGVSADSSKVAVVTKASRRPREDAARAGREFADRLVAFAKEMKEMRRRAARGRTRRCRSASWK